MAYIDVEKGYFTPAQSDLNWAQTFRMTNRAPGIANRIFDTKVHMEDYINDVSQKASATPGLLLSVISDGNNNGVYKILTVKQVSTDPDGTYEKVGDVVRTFDNITTDLEQFIESAAFFVRVGNTTMPFFINKINDTVQQFLLTGVGYYKRTITLGTTTTVSDWSIFIYSTTDSFDTSLSSTSTNVVQNKVVAAALNKKADTDGSYATLSAGNIVPKCSDTVSDSGASFVFRSTAGSKSITDGKAELKQVEGNVDSNWNIFNPTGLKSIGFNAFNGNNRLMKLNIDDNGVIKDATGTLNAIFYVHVLKGIAAEDGNNGYVVTIDGEYPTDEQVGKIRFVKNISDIKDGTTTIEMEYGKHYNSMSFLPPEDGYLVFSGIVNKVIRQNICVHLAWSGYRDKDYEDYNESIFTFTDKLKCHDWGYGRIDDIADKFVFTDESTVEKYIQIDRVLLGSLTWTAFTEQINNVTNYGYKTNGISDTLYAGTDKLLFCGNLGSKWLTSDSSSTLYVHCGTNSAAKPDDWSSVYLLYRCNTKYDHLVVDSTYEVSDFGTEEFIFADNTVAVAGTNIGIDYEPNLVDGLRRLITSAITTVDSDLSTASTNPVENKVVTNALSNKADKDGVCPNMIAGNILAKDVDALTDNASFVFRSSGGSASMSDGEAKLRYVKGNVDEDCGEPFNAQTFRAIGFNAFNPVNVLKGYVLNSNGAITANSAYTLAIVHVLPSTSGAGYNNGYALSFDPKYSGSCADRVGWMGYVPQGAIKSGVTIVNKAKHYQSYSYLMPNYGYMVFNTDGVDLEKICVHLCWSGYRDNDYEAYSHSEIKLPITTLHDWGLGKAVNVYDEINLTDSTAIKRVDRKFIMDLTWTESTTVVQESNPSYDPTDPDSKEYIDVTYYHYSTDDVTDVANNTVNVYIPNMPIYTWGSEDVESVGTVNVTLKKITINTGTVQIDISGGDLDDRYLYYELANYSETAITISPLYEVSDFGTEGFTDYMTVEVACGDAGFYYLPNMLDGLRGLLARDLADAVRIVYVHELTLSQAYIKDATIIDVGSKDLTYVSGANITQDKTTYGKFIDSDSNEYYIIMYGQVIYYYYANIYTATYDESASLYTFIKVGSFDKTKILPKTEIPNFTGYEDYTNTLFHLYTGVGDIYYRWDPEYFEYIATSTHIQANKFYIWNKLLTSDNLLYITLDAVLDNTAYNEYMLQFTNSKTTVPTLSVPNIQWDEYPLLHVNRKYQISIVDKIGLIVSGNY
jgi:hypothetical protein